MGREKVSKNPVIRPYIPEHGCRETGKNNSLGSESGFREDIVNQEAVNGARFRRRMGGQRGIRMPRPPPHRPDARGCRHQSRRPIICVQPSISEGRSCGFGQIKFTS